MIFFFSADSKGYDECIGFTVTYALCSVPVRDFFQPETVVKFQIRSVYRVVFLYSLVVLFFDGSYIECPKRLERKISLKEYLFSEKKSPFRTL